MPAISITIFLAQLEIIPVGTALAYEFFNLAVAMLAARSFLYLSKNYAGIIEKNNAKTTNEVTDTKPLKDKLKVRIIPRMKNILKRRPKALIIACVLLFMICTVGWGVYSYNAADNSIWANAYITFKQTYKMERYVAQRATIRETFADNKSEVKTISALIDIYIQTGAIDELKQLLFSLDVISHRDVISEKAAVPLFIKAYRTLYELKDYKYLSEKLFESESIYPLMALIEVLDGVDSAVCSFTLSNSGEPAILSSFGKEEFVNVELAKYFSKHLPIATLEKIFYKTVPEVQEAIADRVISSDLKFNNTRVLCSYYIKDKNKDARRMISKLDHRTIIDGYSVQISSLVKSEKIYEALSLCDQLISEFGTNKDVIQVRDSIVAAKEKKTAVLQSELAQEELKKIADEHIEELNYLTIRGYMVAMISANKYEVALYSDWGDSLGRAYLMTIGTTFQSTGWFRMNVTPSGTESVKLKDDFGGFVQEWPVYIEVSSEVIKANTEALNQKERAREDLKKEVQKTSRLKSELKNNINGILKTITESLIIK